MCVQLGLEISMALIQFDMAVFKAFHEYTKPFSRLMITRGGAPLCGVGLGP